MDDNLYCDKSLGGKTCEIEVDFEEYLCIYE